MCDFRSLKILIFARASWRRNWEDGPGWAQNVLGSGRLGRVGTAIVFVAVIVVAVVFALVDSAILCYTVERSMYK
jgi:hypothetical protein